MKTEMLFFLDPWYTATKEEAEAYLRRSGIEPESEKRKMKGRLKKLGFKKREQGPVQLDSR